MGLAIARKATDHVVPLDLLIGPIDDAVILYVGMDFFKKKAQTWWFPYDRELAGIMEKAIALFHGRSRRARLKAALGLRKEWRRILKTAPLLNYVLALPRILKK